MKFTSKIIFISALLFLVACAPETVEVTREVMVEKEVEVTRIVEVINEVETEVEVTRVVEVEVETEVEVTRIVKVEVEVTAVPTETPPPPPTNTPAPTSSAPLPTATPEVNLQDVLLVSMTQVRNNINAYGGMIDGALRSGVISCQDIVNTYDAVKNAPTYDTTSASDLVKNAYPAYRNAIDVFVNGSRDMSENCRSFLANPSQAGGIDAQQWSLARLEVGTAVDIIQPAILSLGGE